MKAAVLHHWRELAIFPILMCLVTLYVTAYEPPSGDVSVASTNCTNSTRAHFGKDPSISCPALPDTPYIAERSDEPRQAIIYEDWAWKSFVALNWPAIEPASPSYYRGFPDYSLPFGKGQANTTPVWGTWKEKRELFSVNASIPKKWNYEYDYFVDYPPCSATHAAKIAQMENPRVFAQAGKGLANSFDESVQVPTEARYPSEIAHASVQPKVWRHQRDQDGDNAVIYEVKLNYDYYDYVRDQQLYDDTIKNARAANSGNVSFSGHDKQSKKAVSFPLRLNPQKGGYNGATFNSSQNYAVQYCEEQNRTLSAHPCSTGTIQTKSAWVQLDSSEVQSGKFHWTEAQYYRHDPTVPGGKCTAYGQFGMIGFHIIQKTLEQGHYVYATFEHGANDATPFVYANYFKGNSTIPEGFYPGFNDSPNAIKVTRQHPVFPTTQQTNARYHDLIKAVNPNSVWLNYQLTGVQFIPVQCYDTENDRECQSGGFMTGSDDPTNIGQPFYLANLVIETNWGLQNFQGVPPGKQNGNVPAAFLPTSGYQSTFQSSPYDHYVPNESIDFDRSSGNIGNSRRNPGGRVFNMGGCMGCHGIAQANGSDFSFVLLLGQGGAGVEPVNAPPP